MVILRGWVFLMSEVPPYRLGQHPLASLIHQYQFLLNTEAGWWGAFFSMFLTNDLAQSSSLSGSKIDY